MFLQLFILPYTGIHTVVTREVVFESFPLVAPISQFACYVPAAYGLRRGVKLAREPDWCLELRHLDYDRSSRWFVQETKGARGGNLNVLTAALKLRKDAAR